MRKQLVPNNFTEVCPKDDEWRQDKRYYQRVLLGDLNADGQPSLTVRHILDQWVKKHTWRESCSCPGDCCGHCCESRASWVVYNGKVTLNLVRWYNY